LPLLRDFVTLKFDAVYHQGSKRNDCHAGKGL
jgi:hypothetical protein